MIEVTRADALGEPFRRRVAEVLVSGFADDFASFSRDETTLTDVFAPMLILERFHVARVDGEPAGVATLTSPGEQIFAPSASDIRRHLGLVRGTVTHQIIRTQFMRPRPPDFPTEIGFVATAPAHQGRGVATALLRHLLALPGHREFVLEDIKDTNEPALSLYRKLGFAEYRRRRVRFAGRAGFTHYVSMKRVTGRSC
ncbi:GNAT family N-acetyltransferase [Asanoa sp. WMMD1127]|uniref:GNAT family N-acetyltransferase n=1 Tax=Asanoa sp. WMMD1127 TaxID=3016107 RepID=UPI002415C6F3|nr:GNAT family N-acetyltransferase [Asanoa sp. WMMD1127]MDG4825912.1 GNAT family N-acetyltransferase [Asanoa sp. WMMD1127]